MTARDKVHQAFINALLTDGWDITHDPFPLTYGDQQLYVDVGAEKGAIGAEKGEQKIAVEIKSFLNRSAVHDLQDALGQYEMYRLVLSDNDPERILFLAVPERVYEGYLKHSFGQFILTGAKVKIIVFNERKEVIIKWIN
jgi:XisH protein